MSYHIQCDCGQRVAVKAVQAGSTVTCSCGQALVVPRLSQLKKSGQSQAIAARTGLAKRPLRRENEQLEEHTLVMTPSPLVRQRMDVDACSRFVGQFHKQVHAFLQEDLHQASFVLQIGYALLPDGGLLLDIQASPHSLSDEQLERLTYRLDSLPVPTVSGGPVALMAQIIAGDKRHIQGKPAFQAPFSQHYSRRGPHTLDGIIMVAAGLPWKKEHRWLHPGIRRRLKWVGRQSSAVGDKVIGRIWRRILAWRKGIQVTPERVRAAAERATISQLSQWLTEYPRSDFLLLQRGNRRFTDNQWVEAIADFTDYLRMNPHDTEVLTRRGEAFCNHREVQQGLADFDQVLKIDPNEIDARVGRGTVYLELSAWQAAHDEFSRAIGLSPQLARLYLLRSFANLGLENAAAAIDDLDQCLRLDPYHYEAYVRRAFARQQAGPEGDDVEGWLELIDLDLCRHLELYDDQPAAWAHRAEVRLRRGNIDGAVADCDRALEIDPEFGWAIGIRAVGYRLQERWDLAAADSEAAIQQGLQSADVFLTRAMCLHEQGEIEAALDDCTEAIELNPTQAAAYEFRGVLRMEQGELEEAIEDFTEALQRGADPGRCYVNRGNAYRLSENLDAAIIDYGRAIEHAPETVPAYLNRALAREQQGQIDAAIEDASLALTHQPDSATALDIRGRLWQELGDTDKALEDWTQAIAAAPDYAPAYFNRGHLLLQLNRSDEAEMDFTRLLELCPDWPAAHSSRGSALIQQGELEQAEADFREAIELDPASAETIQQQRLLFEAHYHRIHERYSDAVRLASEALQIDDESRWALDIRASAHWYDEEFVEAVEDFTRVIELDEDAYAGWSGRGQVLAELGEYDQALIDLDKALELAETSRAPSDQAYPLNGKGLALVGLGRFEEARQAFEQSLELCPDNAWTHYNRGLLFFEQGQHRQAVEAFQEAMSCNHPALTPRKRNRARAFLQRYSDSLEEPQS